MRILLSAYACEPNKGSEPGVGWNWAVELARAGHETWVITRANNRERIDSALVGEGCAANLRFVYYDLPKTLSWWKKGRRGVHLYYLLWQVGAYRTARSLTREMHFDMVHHVTLVSMRQPSFMGLLGIPFIFGPASGGEEVPRQLLGSMQRKDRYYELVRCALNRVVRFDPLMHLTFATADTIIATSSSTRDLVPAKYRHKTEVQLAIGVDEDVRSQRQPMTSGFKVLFVGRLLAWKGVTLAVRAFAQLKQHYPDCRFTIIGKGPMLASMVSLERELGIADSVEHLPEVDHEQLQAMYGDFEVMLFPSMRDSGGLVVLEALRSGIPVVCLDQGGPGVIVNDTCGCVIDSSQTEASIVHDLAGALIALANDRDRRTELRRGAVVRALDFTWAHLVNGLYAVLQHPQGSSRGFQSENEAAHIQ